MAEKVSAAAERPRGAGHVGSSCSGSSSGSETLSEEGEPGGGGVAAAAAAPPGGEAAAGRRRRPGEEQASPGGRAEDDASLEERDEEVRGGGRAGAAELVSPARRHRGRAGSPGPEWEAEVPPAAGCGFVPTWVHPLRLISPAKPGAFLFLLPPGSRPFWMPVLKVGGLWSGYFLFQETLFFF